MTWTSWRNAPTRDQRMMKDIFLSRCYFITSVSLQKWRLGPGFPKNMLVSSMAARLPYETYRIFEEHWDLGRYYGKVAHERMLLCLGSQRRNKQHHEICQDYVYMFWFLHFFLVLLIPKSGFFVCSRYLLGEAFCHANPWHANDPLVTN